MRTAHPAEVVIPLPFIFSIGAGKPSCVDSNPQKMAARFLRISLRVFVRCIALLAICGEMSGQSGVASELRLVATANGISWNAFVVENGEIKVQGRDGVHPVPRGCEWRLTGDFKQNGRLFEFSPTYRIIEHPSFTGPLYFAVVNEASSTWTRDELKNSIMVFAWIVNGKAELVAPLAVSSDPETPAGTYVFELPPRFTKGAPVILLLSRRGLVPPKPLFADATAQSTVELIHFGTVAETEGAISRLATLPTRTDGVTLLHIAAEAGHLPATAALLNRGAKWDAETEWRARSVDWAAADGRREIIQLIAGRDAPKGMAQSEKLFSRAIRSGQVDLAADLWRANPGMKGDALAPLATLFNRIDLLTECVARSGRSACAGISSEILARTILLKRTPLLKFLLENGVSANSSVSGASLLLLAADSGNPDAMAALLKASAKPNTANKEGTTPLMLAAHRGATECVELLLRSGADVNARNNAGVTSLHFATARGNAETVAALLRGGARWESRDNQEKNPLEIALEQPDAAIAAGLVAAGARLDLKRPDFSIRLAQAIAFDSAELVKRAQDDGWSADRPVFESYFASDLAAIYSAKHTAASLKNSDGKRSFHLEEQVDSAPRPTKGTRPLDTRPWDTEQPLLAVKVSGLVDEKGRFLFPTIAGSTNPEIGDSIRAAISTWEFSPAMKGGRPVSSTITLALEFKGRSAEIYSREQVDLPPLIKTKGKLSAGTYEKSTISVGAGTTVVHDYNRYGLTAPGEVFPTTEFLAVPTAETLKGEVATFTFIVEPNGRASHIELVDSNHQEFVNSALGALADYRFEPGVRKGTPVRTRMTLTLRPDPE